MTKERDGLHLLIVGIAIFVVIGLTGERMRVAWMIDFKSVYYGARCLVEHRDPYKMGEVLNVYAKESGTTTMNTAERSRVLWTFVNVPTAFLALAPFGLLAWGPAHILWMAATGVGMILSAILFWTLVTDVAPTLGGGLIALWIVNCIGLLLLGNPAGIALSLGFVAVWCLMRERFVLAGVICLALSLTIKPQDTGFVWLYFLLAGGVYRKRALQTLGLTAVLSLCTILWVYQVSPHWFQELSSNLAFSVGPGGENNPAPGNMLAGTVGMMIHLQTVTAILWSDPRFYNWAAYLVCGVLVLPWIAATLRRRGSPDRAWLALAAIAAFSMLPVYHRTHDAKLLLLSVPACAMLYAEKNRLGRLAVIVTAAAFVLTSDLPLLLLVDAAHPLRGSSPEWLGKVATIVLARPAPLSLLAMGSLYLWAYAQKTVESP
jgi:hypothetical protein